MTPAVFVPPVTLEVPAETYRVPLGDLDWDGPPPVDGDLVVLEVTSPASGCVSGPAGWTRCEHGGELLQAWWSVLRPREPDPVFTAPGPVRCWRVHVTAVAGVQVVTAGG